MSPKEAGLQDLFLTKTWAVRKQRDQLEEQQWVLGSLRGLGYGLGSLRGLGDGSGRQRSGRGRNLNFGNHWHLGTGERDRNPWGSVGGGAAATQGSPPAGPDQLESPREGDVGLLGFTALVSPTEPCFWQRDQNPAVGRPPKGNPMPGWSEWEPRLPTPTGLLF